MRHVIKMTLPFWVWALFICRITAFAHQQNAQMPCKNMRASAGMATVHDLKINDDTGAADQESPAIAMNQYGYAVICWTDERNGNQDIYAQIYSAKGFPLGKNFKVSDDGGTAGQRFPDVAVDNTGCFVITWEDYRDDPGYGDIYAQRFEANGEPIESNFKVNRDDPGRDQRTPAIATDANGNFVICWFDARYPQGIYAQRFDSSGTASPEEKIQITDEVISCQTPAISMSQNGNYVVTWMQNCPGSDDIYTQIIDNTGARVGSNLVVSEHPEPRRNASQPDVALAENGDFMITWYHLGDVSVHAKLYSRDGALLRGPFMVHEMPGESGNYNQYPAIAANPAGGYAIVWTASPDGDNDIYRRNFDADGLPTGHSFRVNDPDYRQLKPDIGLDNRGISVMAWEDSRSGNDIYGTASGPLSPLNVTAGSGFDGIIPLSWDAVYGQDGIMNYTIYRSASPEGSYELIAQVDLAERGVFGSLMRDWIDPSVRNGSTLYYRIRAVVGGWESPYSETVSATPSSGGYRLFSDWAKVKPDLDGKIKSSDWNDATPVNIANPYTKAPVLLYLKNTGDYLFVGVQDFNDDHINNGNYMAILFDNDANSKWDPGAPSSDGLIIINKDGALFTGYWGGYPNNLGADMPVVAEGVSSAMYATRQHVEYEIAIDLDKVPLKASAGDEIRIGFWISDPGNFFPYHNGNSGEWPPGLLWEAAKPLGNLTLANDATAVSETESREVPLVYGLSQNFPNPFNPETTIRFDVKQHSPVVLKLYNVLGNELKTLVNRAYQPGSYQITFNAAGLPSGIYYYLIQMQGFRAVRKMVILE
ncbi:T9SS type A sorting domain-containing protein [candidate division KSB1 bacterium]|nr:T9SS type A sorting domain-containing protein [candidate division KSB1 bacterium]